MATIDIDTETGLIKMPMRRVTGIDETRVKAWIELVTMRGEWQPDTRSGPDYEAIFDGATDEEISNDVAERLLSVAGVLTADVLVERSQDEQGIEAVTVNATITADEGVFTVTVGAEV